ncbi:MAG TPA: hypothetical protein VGY54_17070 [Polyangiaceae bacterium]|jgi:hypothetical protein|nr:hypothetical protein [Polyangiaceae bacterium]
MKATLAVAAVMGMMAGAGCARTTVGAVRGPVDLPVVTSEPSAIRVGEPRVVDGHLNLRALRRAEAQRANVERVALNDGGYVLCWTTGTAEQGRSAVAQSFNADGSSRGTPVVISRPDVDVMGTPRATTNDAGFIVATFAGAYESSIALVEVPLEVSARGYKGGDVVAANK